MDRRRIDWRGVPMRWCFWIPAEICFEFLKPAKVLSDLLFQAARQFVATAIRLHPAPEMQMVVVLPGVVEERRILAERAFDNLFERLVLEFGAFQQIVTVGYISLVMLVVMILQRFLRHMGLERVVGVGQIGKLEGHEVMSAMIGDDGLTGDPYRRFPRQATAFLESRR